MGEVKHNLSCEVTGNPCGTDTWPQWYPCKCSSCASWMMVHIANLQTENARLRESNKNLARKAGSDGA